MKRVSKGNKEQKNGWAKFAGKKISNLSAIRGGESIPVLGNSKGNKDENN